MLGLSLFSSEGLPGTHWCPINLPKHTSFDLLFCLYSHAFGELSIRIIRSHLTHQILTTSKARQSGAPSTSGRDKEWFCYVDHPSILEVSVRFTLCQSLVFFLHLHAYLWIHKESFPSAFSFSVEGQCDLTVFIWQSLFCLACPFVPWLMMLNNFVLQKSPQRLSVTATISSLSRKLIMGLRSVLICSCASDHYIYTT